MRGGIPRFEPKSLDTRNDIPTGPAPARAAAANEYAGGTPILQGTRQRADDPR